MADQIEMTARLESLSETSEQVRSGVDDTAILNQGTAIDVCQMMVESRSYRPIVPKAVP